MPVAHRSATSTAKLKSAVAVKRVCNRVLIFILINLSGEVQQRRTEVRRGWWADVRAGSLNVARRLPDAHLISGREFAAGCERIRPFVTHLRVHRDGRGHALQRAVGLF